MPTHFFSVVNTFSFDSATPYDSISRKLPGVSLMSEGEAKGHQDSEGRQIVVDGETLKQVFACAQKGGGNVKFKMDHGSGVMSTEGWVDNIRLAGKKLLGDLNFYESSDPKLITKVFEIASKNPTHLGMSLEFAGPDVATGESRSLARCTELYTAALVSDPAANKSLFEEKKLAPVQKFSMTQSMADDIKDPSVDPKTDNPSPDDVPAWAKTMMKKFDDDMTTMKQVMSKYEDKGGDAPPATDKDKQPTTPPAQDDEDKKFARAAEMGAELAIKRMSANLGIKPVSPGVTKDADEVKEKSFATIVDEKTKELGDKNKAILFCIKNHPKEYAASRLVAPKSNTRTY